MTYYKVKKKRTGLKLLSLLVFSGVGVYAFYTTPENQGQEQTEQALQPAFQHTQEAIKKLLALQPEQNPMQALMLARMYSQKGEYLKSADYYQIALKAPWTKAEHYRYKVEFAKVLNLLGNNAEANAILEKLQNSHPDSSLAFNVSGVQKEKQNNLKKAEANFKKAVQAEPEDPKSYNNLARVLKKQQLPNDQLVLEKAIEQTNSHPEAYANLILSHLEKGDLEKAEAVYQSAETELTQKPSDLLLLKSLINEAKGNYHEAEKNLSDALHLSPGNTRALTLLARVQVKLQSEKALETYRLALESEPSNIELAREYEQAYLKLTSQLKKQEPVVISKEESDEQEIEESALDSNEELETSTAISSLEESSNDLTNQSSTNPVKSEQSTEQLISNDINSSAQAQPEPGITLSKEKDNTSISQTSTNQETELPKKTAKEDLNNLLAKGKKAFLAGEYAKSENFFKQVYSSDKNYPGIHYFLARTLHMRQDFESASVHYEAVKENEKEKPKSLYYHGRMLLEMNQAELAIKKIAEAVSQKPDVLAWEKSLAVAYQKNKEYAKAEELYRKITSDHKQDQGAWLQLGLLQKKTGKFEAADTSLRKATDLNPSDQDAWLHLGESYLDQKNYQQAQSTFRNLLALNPGHSEGNYHLLSTHQVLRQADEGLAHFANLPPQLQSFARFQYIAGKLYEQKSDLQRARLFFENSVQKDKGYYQGWLSLGNIESELNRYPNAIKAYEQAKSIKPDSLEPGKNLALLHEKQGDYQKSQPLWLSLIVKDQRNLGYRLAYAQSLEKTGNFKAAKKQYESVLEIKTTEPQAMEKLGFLFYRNLDAPEQALVTFERLLKHHPAHPRKEEINRIIDYLGQS